MGEKIRYILTKIAYIYLKIGSEKIWSVDPFFPKNWARSYHYLFASNMSQIRSRSRSDHSRSFLKLRFTTSHHYFSTKLTLPTLFITFLCINFLQRFKNWKNFLKELWKKLWKKFSYKKNFGLTFWVKNLGTFRQKLPYLSQKMIWKDLICRSLFSQKIEPNPITITIVYHY